MYNLATSVTIPILDNDKMKSRNSNLQAKAKPQEKLWIWSKLVKHMWIQEAGLKCCCF